jgi:hypothetical protein
MSQSSNRLPGAVADPVRSDQEKPANHSVGRLRASAARRRGGRRPVWGLHRAWQRRRGRHRLPVRFRCVGCGHFRTDVSYFLDMEAYLADLRAQPGTSARHLRCRPVRRLPRLLTAEIRGVALPQNEAGGHADAGRPARRAMEVLGGGGPAGPADRLAARRPGNRPAHRAPHRPVAVRV